MLNPKPMTKSRRSRNWFGAAAKAASPTAWRPKTSSTSAGNPTRSARKPVPGRPMTPSRIAKVAAVTALSEGTCASCRRGSSNTVAAVLPARMTDATPEMTQNWCVRSARRTPMSPSTANATRGGASGSAPSAAPTGRGPPSGNNPRPSGRCCRIRETPPPISSISPPASTKLLRQPAVDTRCCQPGTSSPPSAEPAMTIPIASPRRRANQTPIVASPVPAHML